MRLSANLTAYILLTVLVLWAVADRFAPYHGQAEAGCMVGYVYDGDTVELLCDGQSLTARLQGFDAPETKSPKCASEAAWGQRATLRLRQLVQQPGVKVFRNGFDKYGRVLIVLTINGQDAAQIMVGQGLAVAYHGAARRNWCA